MTLDFKPFCLFIHKAAANDKLGLMKRYLSNNPECDLNITDPEGWTALHWACANNSLACFGYLIDQYVDVNKLDDKGWSPLLVAAAARNQYFVDVLLRVGADPNQLTDQGSAYWELMLV